MLSTDFNCIRKDDGLLRYVLWVIDGWYLPVELVCLYVSMIHYVLASGVGLCVLTVECVYLHRARALELGWLDDDLGQDVFRRLSTLGS